MMSPFDWVRAPYRLFTAIDKTKAHYVGCQFCLLFLAKKVAIHNWKTLTYRLWRASDQIGSEPCAMKASWL
jgi:hypothetical protein